MADVDRPSMSGGGNTATPILTVAIDFHSPTGATAPLLAAWSGVRPVLLFSGRGVASRRASFRSLARQCAAVHWHLNLANFPSLMQEAQALSGVVPQVAAVHHVEAGEEAKVTSLVGVVDAIHVPAPDIEAMVRALAPAMDIAQLPYLVDGWCQPRTRRRREGTDDAFTVGWCGRSRTAGDRKRLEVLVRALALAREEAPQVRLLIQGTIPQATVKMASSLGVPVKILSQTPWRARAGFYNEIDAYASPSSVEGGPLPVLEAAARGVPVLTTAVGMASQLLERQGALQLPVDDPEEQSEVLIAIAESAPRDIAAMGLRHRAAAFELAGPPAVGRYEDVWDQLGAFPAPNSEKVGVSAWNRSELALDQVEEGRAMVRAGDKLGGLAELAHARPWRARTAAARHLIPVVREFARSASQSQAVET